MEGLILPNETKIKNEKSQMYLENNLNVIKNIFPDDIYNNYQRYIANKEKENIDYKILSNKVGDINFYNKYNTLYNYFSELNNVEKTSIKNKSFLGNLSKGFNPQSGYTKKGGNNIEKTYSDLFLDNKNIDDVLYKNVKKELNDKNNNIFQEAKKLLGLRVEIYKKLVFEEENLNFEKSIGETVKLKNWKDNLSEIPVQKDFIKNIENKSKTIYCNLFKDYFNFESPTILAKKLFEIKNLNENNELANVIKSRIIDLEDKVDKMSEDEKETEKPDRISEIVKDILEFNNKIQEHSGEGVKILTPNQMLSRLPITLVQLKVVNNSEKLKNEIRQLLYSLYRSKKLRKNYIKV